MRERDYFSDDDAGSRDMAIAKGSGGRTAPGGVTLVRPSVGVSAS